MNRTFSWIALMTTTLAAVAPTTGAEPPAVKVTGLRCEYLVDPLGIDARQPRLSWMLTGGDRGLKQSAYQVLVASTAEKLAADQGDRWDSGKAAGAQSIHVEYAGQPLVSQAACHWKVRVWDENDRPSDWSEPASWTMGLLEPSDWKGKWIGLDSGHEPPKRTIQSDWIWLPGGRPAAAAPLGKFFFRRTIAIPAGTSIAKAESLLSADNSFTLWVNGEKAATGNSFHTFVATDLADKLRPGKNTLAVTVVNAGTAPNPAGLLGQVRIELSDGQKIVANTDKQWKCSDKEAADWEKPAFDDSGWVAARSIGPSGMKPWGDIAEADDRRLPARMLRREFDLSKPVRRALAHVSGLGLFELYVNGKRTSDNVLQPGLTQYEKRVFYVTFDVTGQLRQGKNALGVRLGNGRYFAPRTNVPTKTETFGYPKLLLQLQVDYADGTSDAVTSDEAWKLTVDGPIRANNEYDGEEYDARKKMPGWAAPGFDASAWQPVEVVDRPAGALSAQMMPPIRVVETIRPVSLTQPRPGTFIFDMGQNMVGWCKLRVQGAPGTQVSLRFAETIRPDGLLYLDNIRGAKVTDLYTLSGEGAETFEPRFTYHGFRYVEMRGYPGQPDLNAIEGCVVHDDLPSAGTFSCSHPLLNRIYRNIRWGVRGNYRSIPTDCPQRDERQGWLGDRSAESKGETYLFQIAPLYANWIAAVEHAQKESGSVPDVAPSYWPLYSDNVTWPSSLVIIPDSLYVQYGDTRVIRDRYAAMKRWIDYMRTFLKDDIMPRDQYGDWCVPPERQELIHSLDPKRKTAKEVLGTTYYYHCLTLMARYADMLHKPADAAEFRALADRLKKALNARFFNKDLVQYDNGSQTSSVLPLAFDMAPPEYRKPLFDKLVEKILRETDGHIGTGLIGGQWLMRVLSDNGRPELAYRLATQTTYPSWGYMIGKNATTVWELWNGDTADPAMNSGNHVMLVGDLCIWMHEYLAGIRPDPSEPAFKHVIMRPCAVPGLDSAEAVHESMYGAIRSAWKLESGKFAWQIALPGNTRATVYVPAADAAKVSESGRPAPKSPGVKFLRMEAGAAVYEIGAGQYSFVSSK